MKILGKKLKKKLKEKQGSKAKNGKQIVPKFYKILKYKNAKI